LARGRDAPERISDLRYFPFVVLLGEPGIGKSTVDIFPSGRAAPKSLVFSLGRVPEDRWPKAAPHFPSCGHVLVKTALRVWRSGNLTASFVTLERQPNEFHAERESN
jgi:hypothetical protein